MQIQIYINFIRMTVTDLVTSLFLTPNKTPTTISVEGLQAYERSDL